MVAARIALHPVNADPAGKDTLPVFFAAGRMPYAALVERLRARYGLPSLGYNVQRSYTDADLRLYANFSELLPDVMPSERSAFIGPFAWSPSAAGKSEFLEELAGY